MRITDLDRRSIMRYTINGFEYVSVTELIGQIAKGDPFYKWIGQQALETGKADGYKEYRDNTADIGSEVHRLIELYIQDCINNSHELVYIPKISLKDYSGQVQRMFQSWIDWKIKNVKKFLFSEITVVHEFLCYAGTLDCIYVNHKDEVCLCDWKTKDGIYPEDGLQVVAYKNAFEYMHGDYKITKKYSPEYTQSIETFKIDCVQMLTIPREKAFDESIHFVDFTEKIAPYTRSIEGLLIYFYTLKARRMKNYRAQDRC
jgi:hypothetical protein